MKQIKRVFNIFFLLIFFNTQIQASTTSNTSIKSVTCQRVAPEVIKKLDKINKVESLYNLHIDDLPTFDEVFDLMESFIFNDEDEIEGLYTDEELDIINAYFIKMARLGVSPGDEEKLEKEIAELLSDDESEEEYDDKENESEEKYSFSPKYHDDNKYITFSSYDDWNRAIFCSNPIKKTVRATKNATKKTTKGVKKAGKFIKKNAKTIAIVTAAVVVAGVTTYYIVSSKSSEPSYPTTSQEESLKVENKNNSVICENEESVSYQDSVSNCSIEREQPIIAEVLKDNITTFKADLQENNNFNISEKNQNLWDKTKEILREIAAHETHKFLDEVSDYAKLFPRFMDETGSICNRFIPDELLNDMKDNSLYGNLEKTIIENYEENVSDCHQKIDQIFAVNQSEDYTKEAKEYREKDWSIAFLPPPSPLLKGNFNIKKLSDAGKSLDRAGLTKAGRAFAKHGGREGSIFPKPLGNTKQINQQGQKLLESILNDKKSIYYDNRFGGIDVFEPNGKGARFDMNNNFMGFLQPRK
ncbi:MAG: hypothetical protein KR126chlam6_00085 [Candidatus Anoxychlamydiales bacterium]|nr:hypothetical protein [Candidatus Anoxychlamydiales bacterium]